MQIEDIPPDAVSLLLREEVQAMLDRFQPTLDEAGLIWSHWLTLKLMQEGRIRYVNDIARHVGMTSGATTRLIDRLETRGWIHRLRTNEDRRLALALTNEGRAVVILTQCRLSALWEKDLADFPPSRLWLLF